MVNKETAFWDTSALVPFCVREATSVRMRAYFRKYFPVVWWGTVVEVRSAISRLYRSKDIDAKEATGAVTRLDQLGQVWREILPDNDLRELACHLVGQHPLRAGDSLQLAAALTWCHNRPSGRTFICADKRLSSAATAAGFTVIQL